MRWISFLINICLLAMTCGSAEAPTDWRPSQPNVVIILADDLAYGDLGIHGNPRIRTPNLDRLAKTGASFEYFYISPVDAPTRASLLAGRYNYRTGVVGISPGTSLMHPQETTLAEVMGEAGYQTGLFGTWGLGDNLPLRPMDQGFQETLVQTRSEMNQSLVSPGGSNNFNLALLKNGEPVRKEGYSADIFTDAAISFINSNASQPFLVWLAFNSPREPWQVPSNHYNYYRAMNLAPADFPSQGHPLPPEFSGEATATAYAEINSLDDNVGRLLARLEELHLATNTLVFFSSASSPQNPRYNGGLLQGKGSVYEGGLRVPFFVNWPEHIPADTRINHVAAHIDLAPTVLEACGLAKPSRVHFDGLSLWPLLLDHAGEWPDRTLFFQWHQGDIPELYRCLAVRTPVYKLVQPLGTSEAAPDPPIFKLFDMLADPMELKDIASEKPALIKDLCARYEAWFKEVGSTRGYGPVPICLGSIHENPTILNRHDWRGAPLESTPDSLGHWEVKVVQKAKYRVVLHFPPTTREGSAHLTLRERVAKVPVVAGATACVFENLTFTKGNGRLETWLMQGGKILGLDSVEVERLSSAESSPENK